MISNIIKLINCIKQIELVLFENKIGNKIYYKLFRVFHWIYYYAENFRLIKNDNYTLSFWIKDKKEKDISYIRRRDDNGKCDNFIDGKKTKCNIERIFYAVNSMLYNGFIYDYVIFKEPLNINDIRRIANVG